LTICAPKIYFSMVRLIMKEPFMKPIVEHTLIIKGGGGG